MEFDYLKQYILDNENNLKELLNAQTDELKRELVMSIIANLINMEEDIKDEIKDLCKTFKIRKTKVVEWMKEDSEEDEKDEQDEEEQESESNGQREDNVGHEEELKPKNVKEQAKEETKKDNKLVFSQPKKTNKKK